MTQALKLFSAYIQNFRPVDFVPLVSLTQQGRGDPMGTAQALKESSSLFADETGSERMIGIAANRNLSVWIFFDQQRASIRAV